MKHIALGIVAHVDAGKTTLSEALLYKTGALRALGRVDDGDSFLDSEELERRRGITVHVKQAVMTSGGVSFTLVDTPGHADLCADCERAVWALDCAVLLVSAPEGVRTHTLTLWRMLERMGVPTFIFVNKCDLPCPGRAQVTDELRRRLSRGCVDLGAPDGELFEQAAMCDERLMASFFERGALGDDELARAVFERKIFPCVFGSARTLEGVGALLDALCRFTPPGAREDGPLRARVYKITTDERGARLTHIKVNSGALHTRDAVSSRGGEEEKITALRVYSGERFTAVDTALPGMTVAATGLANTYAGEGIGEPDAPRLSPLPSMSFRVSAGDVDPHEAYSKLRRLGEEDPSLCMRWDPESGEIRVDVSGEVRLEVLASEAESRFGLALVFDEGRTAYRETVARKVEGVGHFEPLRHYAEVHLLLEPLERGGGLEFRCACREDELPRQWQRLALACLSEKTHRGVLTGAPLTDTRITVTAGRVSVKHTEGGDIREAVGRAVRQGLRTAGTVLLEPCCAFTLELPREHAGRAMADLERMGAEWGAPEYDGEGCLIKGSAPAEKVRDYPAEVTRYTSGRGRVYLEPAGYRPCKDAEAVVAEAGYDCDGDLANTADSVFCTGGAGRIVPWHEVYAHAHIPVAYRPERQGEDGGAGDVVTRERSARYAGTLAEDRELLKIFERTYGPVKRDLRAALKRAEDPVLYAAVPRALAQEYLLVDGYNIIFAWDELRALAEVDIDEARETLINRLCNYQGYCKNEVIVVFDAYRVAGGAGSVERRHNISVVYTKEAETADMYIEKATRRLVKERRVRVATSDGLEQLIIIGAGARRISAEMFHSELETVERAVAGIVRALGDS